MALNLSNASNILKVRYIGPIREQLNNSTILLSRIGREDNAISVSGKTFTVPLHTGRNSQAGSGRADGGTLPSAAQQGYNVAVVPNVYNYTTIKVTGPTIAAARDNAGAFVRAVESEIQGAMMDMKRSMNRQLHSDGTGALAYWTAADNSSGTDVDDNRGNAFVYLNGSNTTRCDLIDATDDSTVLGDSIVVTLGAKAAANYAITWTGSVSGSADTDYLVLEDSLGNEMTGIDGIIDSSDPTLPTGGLHGLAVASHTYWVAQESNNSGTNRALTLALMQTPLDDIAQNSDFDENAVKFLLCSYGVRAKYIDLLLADKRHVNTMTLDGGFRAVDFNGVPLVPDPQCRKNVIYYVSPASLKIFRTADFSWMDKDGAVLNRVAGEDAYDATLFHYGNIGTIARNANGKLDDITE